MRVTVGLGPLGVLRLLFHCVKRIVSRSGMEAQVVSQLVDWCQEHNVRLLSKEEYAAMPEESFVLRTQSSVADVAIPVRTRCEHCRQERVEWRNTIQEHQDALVRGLKLTLERDLPNAVYVTYHVDLAPQSGGNTYVHHVMRAYCAE